ncbi:flagellar protein FlgJ, putative [Roseibacterium elongatum DSM 19469]|uniref:Flagellar protein FlgJ, putative n=1 Tax=Roseicyclus elongatus DSM 19469 TaxID=1294273 RepID=W8S0L8_9RHOB|nr:rod-binding protein [Roseibacterium elongatum]AHM03697.1 flagellar protein FlgJ, putative [Roseibacterium elongatum DSM 19469]
MTVLTDATALSAPPPRAAGDHRHAALREAAQELEAAFLAEMLKHAGMGATRGSFGGGAGEDQFSSLLRAEQARAIAERGGLGLAESLFQALVARSEDGQGAP